MKVKNKIISIFLLLSSICYAEEKKDTPSNLMLDQEYQIDQDHTQVAFDVSHLVISFVTGHFREFDGHFYFDPKDFSKTSLMATAVAKSVDTGIGKRDADLRSVHFFWVQKYPLLKFKSTKVLNVKQDQKKFDLQGDLTIRGVTKSVVFNVDYMGEVKLKDKIIQAFRAKTIVNRHDFGLNFQNFIEAVPMVGDDVTISIAAEGFKEEKK